MRCHRRAGSSLPEFGGSRLTQPSHLNQLLELPWFPPCLLFTRATLEISIAGYGSSPHFAQPSLLLLLLGFGGHRRSHRNIWRHSAPSAGAPSARLRRLACPRRPVLPVPGALVLECAM